MEDKFVDFPNKEDVLEAVLSNPNLKILEEEDDYTFFEDVGLSFLEGKTKKFVFNHVYNLDFFVKCNNPRIEFLVNEFIDTLPEILFLTTKEVVIEENENSEEIVRNMDGVIYINTPAIENQISSETDDLDVVDFDSIFEKKILILITKNLFKNVVNNPIFFGELELSDIDFEKYLI